MSLAHDLVLAGTPAAVALLVNRQANRAAERRELREHRRRSAADRRAAYTAYLQASTERAHAVGNAEASREARLNTDRARAAVNTFAPKHVADALIEMQRIWGEVGAAAYEMADHDTPGDYQRSLRVALFQRAQELGEAEGRATREIRLDLERLEADTTAGGGRAT